MNKLLHFRNWLYKIQEEMRLDGHTDNYEVVTELIDYFEDHFSLEISSVAEDEND